MLKIRQDIGGKFDDLLMTYAKITSVLFKTLVTSIIYSPITTPYLEKKLSEISKNYAKLILIKICRHAHHPYFCIVRNTETGLSQESLPFHLTLRGKYVSSAATLYYTKCICACSLPGESTLSSYTCKKIRYWLLIYVNSKWVKLRYTFVP